MAHEILGDRFISRSQPAWHNIARRIFSADETITASEAMAEVAGDVQVIRAPLFYELDGVNVRAEGQQAIIRKPLPDDPQPLVLGITSDSWTAASYADLARALDDLSRTYKVETAGLLQKGGLAFLCFRAEDYEVRGDEMRTYFAANFSLTPGVGHKVFHSPVRVVCWNTNTAAQNQATINLAVPHAADSLQRIKLAAQLVERFRETKDRTKAIFEAFADCTITSAEADRIFEAAHPDPTVPASIRLLRSQLSETEAETFKRALTPDLLMSLSTAQDAHDRAVERTATLRRICRERYEAFEPVALSGTAWAAYNAVTEVADWREGRAADESTLVGARSREKSRAFVEAAAVAGIN